MTTPDLPRSPRRSVMKRLLDLLGITEISAWTHDVNHQLEDLTERFGGHRFEELAQTARALETRLEQTERELLVWRFRAWFERTRPTSDRLVTVVTATRNRAELLSRCIDSVLAQLHTRWELIVVDDGSDDSTPDVVARYSDPRICSLRTERGGVCAARNRALERAKGSIVAYLDDDNSMDPMWLASAAWLFDQRPDTTVLYGARLIDDEAAVRRLGLGGFPMLHFEWFDRAALRRANILDTNVIAHRADDPEAHFDEELSQYGDWDLMLRLTRDRDAFALPAIACVYSTTAPGRLSDGAIDAEYAMVREKHGLDLA